MHLIRTLILVAGVAALGLSTTAAEPAKEPRTLLTERGKLLFSDDLNQPLGREWRAAKGKWEVVDGAVRGTELKADMHVAVTRHAMDFRNVVIQYSFKLDGTGMTTLSINASKGHLCRVLVTPTGFTVRKDDTDKMGPDQAVVFETRNVAIKPGEWHTLLIEIHGKEMLASLDGKELAFGEHEALDQAKANFGFTVRGESASFKDLRVWEALPNKNWEATKARLLEARKKK
jgi:hypothetical protein